MKVIAKYNIKIKVVTIIKQAVNTINFKNNNRDKKASQTTLPTSPDFDPVFGGLGDHQSFEVITPSVQWRSLVDFLCLLKDPNWNITMEEGQPFQQEPSSLFNALHKRQHECFLCSF